jgi:hypothetical protein
MKHKMIFLTLVGFFVISLASSALGAPILIGSSGDGLTWTATDGNRDATAMFSATSSGFEILLSSSASSTSDPSEVLAGLFFGLSGGTADNPDVDAIGSVTIDGSKYSVDFGDDMNGEWAFLTGIDGINGGLGDYGISSTAFDPEAGSPAGWNGFGSASIIDSSVAYVDPLSPNGAEFGIVSGDISGLPSSVTSYVEDSVLISFNFTGDFGPSTVDELYFLYGTSYEGTPVPEPATIIMLGSGLIGLGLLRKRFRRK